MYTPIQCKGDGNCLFNAVSQLISGGSQRALHISPVQYITKKNPETKTNTIVVSKDGNVIACWHPEPEFPYECTRPMPREEKSARMGDSVLKVQAPEDYKHSEKPYGPKMETLAEIFSTAKHNFRHKPFMRKKLYKRNLPLPPDRESI